MSKENTVLTRMASESSKDRWGLTIGRFLVYGLIPRSTRSIGNYRFLISLVISGPFALGAATFSLPISQGKEARLEQILGFLWLIPYIHITMAKFYDDIIGT